MILELIHISLPAISPSWSNENFQVCLMRNKWKRKEKRNKNHNNPYWEWNSIVFHLPESGKMNWYIFFIGYWIRRDWRGSNPQLPPWQGGALTNWTTIPGNWGIEYPFFYDLIQNISFLIRIFVLEPRRKCYLNISMNMHLSENHTNY